MSVGVLVVVRIEVSPNENITHSLPVHVSKVLGLPDNKSNFKFLYRLWTHVKLIKLCSCGVLVVYVSPHFDHTLRNCACWVIELSVLNWFPFSSLPCLAEVSVVQVHQGFSYEVISEEVIIVVGPYFDCSSAWEVNMKFIALVEIGFGRV